MASRRDKERDERDAKRKAERYGEGIAQPRWTGTDLADELEAQFAEQEGDS